MGEHRVQNQEGVVVAGVEKLHSQVDNQEINQLKMVGKLLVVVVVEVMQEAGIMENPMEIGVARRHQRFEVDNI